MSASRASADRSPARSSRLFWWGDPSALGLIAAQPPPEEPPAPPVPSARSASRLWWWATLFTALAIPFLFLPGGTVIVLGALWVIYLAARSTLRRRRARRPSAAAFAGRYVKRPAGEVLALLERWDPPPSSGTTSPKCTSSGRNC